MNHRASADLAHLRQSMAAAGAGAARLDPETALAIIERVPHDELVAGGDRTRARLHPDGRVTYVVDRNVNYSNICTCVCAFCAFYRRPGHVEGYTLTHDEIAEKVAETLELGGSGILMQGGLHPDLPLDWYTGLFRTLKARFPQVYLHCLSPTEIHGLTRVTGLAPREILMELRDAGLDSIPGGGGEILVDSFRRKRRSSCTSDEWLSISAEAHRVGLPTTATMMFGMGETSAMRVAHLDRLRRLQDETGGFIAFIPWTFQPDNTPLGKAIPDRVPVDEYLRWLALSRLYLDNIRNIQVSWLTQGLEGGKQGLRGGANDLGSIMIEENVISPAGAHHTAREMDLRQAILDVGLVPALRNAGYHRLPDRPIPAAARGHA